MCLLCIELPKGYMTPEEVARAYDEIEIEFDHWSEVHEAIYKYSDMDLVTEELIKKGQTNE